MFLAIFVSKYVVGEIGVEKKTKEWMHKSIFILYTDNRRNVYSRKKEAYRKCIKGMKNKHGFYDSFLS